MDNNYNLTPEEYDYLARTVYGEANGEPPEGKAAVAAVALNRLRSGRYGKSMSDVLFAPGQFEPWTSRAQELMDLPQGSSAYQSAAQAVNSALSGNDPTNGATHFLNPNIVLQRSGALPDWAVRSQGQRIGNHVFMAPEGRVTAQASSMANVDDLYNKYASKPAAPSAAAAKPDAAPAASVDDLYTKYSVPKTAAPAAPEPAPAATAAAPAAPAPNPNGILANDPTGDTYPTAIAKGAGTVVAQGADDAASAMAHTRSFGDYLLARAEGAIHGGFSADSPQVLAALQNQKANQARYDNAQPTGNKLVDFLHSVNMALRGGEQALPQPGDVSNAITAKTGQYTPETYGGQLAMTGARTVVGAALNPLMRAGAGNPVAAAASNALPLAATGAVAQGATDLTGDPLAGVAAGAVVNPLLAKTGAGLRNSIVGKIENPEVAKLADAAVNKYGIPLSAPQVSDNPSLAKFNSMAGKAGGGAPWNSAATEAAWNRALANEMGANADRITPNVMENTRQRIGTGLDDAARRVGSIDGGAHVAADTAGLLQSAQSSVDPAIMPKIVENTQRLLDAFSNNGGKITGEQYLNMTKRGSWLDAARNSNNSDIANYADQLKDILDSALERSAPAGVRQEIGQLRYQWKVMKTLEPLVQKGTPGEISPGSLQNLVNKNFSGAAYGRAGNMKELADIGYTFMKEPPSSGTPEGLQAYAKMAAIPRAVGALASGNIPGAVAEMAPYALGPTARIAQGVMNGPSATNALIARSLGRPVAPGLGNKLFQLSIGTAPQRSLQRPDNK